MNKTCIRCSLPAYSRGLCARCYTREHNAGAWLREEKRLLREEMRQQLSDADLAEKERRIARYAEQHERGSVLNYQAVVAEQRDIESDRGGGVDSTPCQKSA